MKLTEIMTSDVVEIVHPDDTLQSAARKVWTGDFGNSQVICLCR